MASALDPTKPADGIPAAKSDLRSNLQVARAELDHGGFAEGFAPSFYGPPASSRVSDHLAAIDVALAAGPPATQVWMSVKNFGAKGDGVSDDTADLQAALDSGNPVLWFPSGTYLVSAPLNVPPGVTLAGAGADTTIIKSSSGGLAQVIRCTGPALTQLASLSTSASIGDNKVTLTSPPSGLEELRDVIVLHRPGDLWNVQRTYYDRGEFQLLSKVSGAELHLVGTLYDDYASGGGTDVFRMQAASVEIRDLTIDANGSDECLYLELINGGAFAGVRMLNADWRGVNILRCYGLVFDRCLVAQTTETSGDRYGFKITNSQRVQVVRCTASSIRHAVTLGGVGGGVRPVNRDVWVEHSTIGLLHALGEAVPQNFAAAADHHGNVENCGFRYCTIYGGVAVSGSRNHYVGNHIITSSASGTFRRAFSTRELKSLSHFITGNIVDCGNDELIRAVGSGSVEEDVDLEGTLVVADNIVIGTGTAYFIDFDIENPASVIPLNVIIRGNTFQGGRTNIARFTSQDPSVNWNNVTMLDNVLPAGATLTMTDVDNFRQMDLAGDDLVFGGLPTANPGGSGRLWSDNGTLKIT